MTSRTRSGLTTSLTHQQLEHFGCLGKDKPQTVLAPPPTYLPIPRIQYEEATARQKVQTKWFPKLMQVRNDEGEEYNTRTASEIELKERRSAIPWIIMPDELKRTTTTTVCPLVEKDNKDEVKKTNKRKSIDILKDLEKKINDADIDKSDDENKEANDVGSDDNVENENVDDEEMDEEIDYGANYFDNGEAYDDDGDHMDDEPVF